MSPFEVTGVDRQWRTVVSSRDRIPDLPTALQVAAGFMSRYSAEMATIYIKQDGISILVFEQQFGVWVIDR